MEKDLNIDRNIRNLIINRLKNPKFANNIEVCKSLGLSERYLYFKVKDLDIDLGKLCEIRKSRREKLEKTL